MTTREFALLREAQREIAALREQLRLFSARQLTRVYLVLEGTYDGSQPVYAASTESAAEEWMEARKLDNKRRDPSTRYDVWVEEWNVDGDDFGDVTMRPAGWRGR